MSKTVPWYNKTYAEIVENGMLEQVKTHIRTELSEEQQIEYVKFLINMVKFPSNFMGQNHGR